SGDVVASTQGQTVTGRRLNAFNAVQSALEYDLTPPAAPGNLHVAAQSGRTVTLQWTAPGDDGNSGTASNYDFIFTSALHPGGMRLPTAVLPAAAGTTQSATLTLPFRNFSGTVTMFAFDNVGNAGSANVNVTVTQNAGSDPYVVTESAAESLSTGGTALALNGDDAFKENVALPFTFPFFGVNHTSINVSTNGALYFSRIPRDSDGTTGLDADSSSQGLNGQTMIAGIWDDLRTDRPGGDVFVTQDANHIIFRWQAVTFDTPLVGGSTRGEQPVNFEIELRRDGTIIERFGAGQSAPTNTQLVPVVGIGGGEPDAYVVTSHTSDTTLRSLTNAQTVAFVPRAAPNQPPTVRMTSPTTGLVIAAPAQINLTAAASDPDGSISSVEFFANGTSVGFRHSNGNGT